MPIKTRSSKPSVGLATALTDKYRENPFFRSTVNVIALQTALTVLTITVFAFAVAYQQTETVHALRLHIQSLASGGAPTPGDLASSFQTIQYQTLGTVFGVLFVLTLFFGFLAARYALLPTRDSLEYQKRFIGNIAHELRTPLAIMRTNTEVALMDSTLSEYSRSTFANTIEELDRISETINNLLSFDTLLRPGRIKTEPVKLLEVLGGVILRHKELADTRGIELTAEVPETLYVTGNGVALGQVFTNLVKNALNYTPQHDSRSVTVRATETEDRVSVSVTDTGIGIAQKDLYHVFEPFFRGDTSRTRGIGSGTSGLGLAIVNDIVRAHSGSIIIRSALNRGTTIEISFPKPETTESVENAIALEDDGELHEVSVVKS
ncbi:MAG: Two-component system, NtrC family, sensor histidine kinase HydH [Parcubacteria group bacterium]|nr:Two-component system, NtrC family, sensor histidine kinase HydH [Parcubacteria group bacterium]